MLDLQDRYTWRATRSDGTTFTEGADLTEAVMVSIVPQHPLLPQHDLAGVKLVRRFGRGFINAMGGGLRDYVHCVVAETFRFYLRSSDGAVLITPPDYELYL